MRKPSRRSASLAVLATPERSVALRTHTLTDAGAGSERAFTGADVDEQPAAFGSPELPRLSTRHHTSAVSRVSATRKISAGSGRRRAVLGMRATSGSSGSE